MVGDWGEGASTGTNPPTIHKNQWKFTVPNPQNKSPLFQRLTPVRMGPHLNAPLVQCSACDQQEDDHEQPKRHVAH